MINPFIQFIMKNSVLLVDIEIVVLVKIIGNINVRPSIVINVRHANAKTIANV